MYVVVDSSGWIEYFVGGPNCEYFEEAIHNVEKLVVPSISITEVLQMGYAGVIYF